MEPQPPKKIGKRMNKEKYSDPTADKAIANVMREEKRKKSQTEKKDVLFSLLINVTINKFRNSGKKVLQDGKDNG